MNYKLFLSSILLAVLVLFSCVDLKAQRIKPDRWFVSADGGVSIFFGDVKRYDYVPDFESPSEIQPMFSFNVGKGISPVVSVKGQFLYGNISGHKQSAKYNFKGTTYGGHLMADFNLIYLFTKQRYGNSRFNVNLGIGLGYLLWDSKLYHDIPLADGTDLMDENSGGAISIPGALNIEYLINKNISVGVTGNLFVVNSDDVDAKAGGIKTDMINYNSLGVVYRFSSKRKASRRSVKYRLDPSLYEPIEKDKPTDVVEESVVENEEVDDVIPVQNEVKDEVVPVEVLVESDKIREADKTERKTEEVAVVKKPKVFRINHELENEAIEKETWASKEDKIWEGISFSVQVAATKTPWDLEELQESLGLTSRVYERHEGSWYRYSVGDFNKMWRAKELRNSVRSLNGIEDAFIVVYRDDKSISLEEALNYAARQQTVVLVKEDAVVEELNEKKVYPLIRLDESVPEEGLVIGIQILSMKNDHYPMGVLSGIYGIEKPIIVSKSGDWNKLIVGGFDSYNDALDYQEYARDKGFIDAFVVAYKDGKRISISTLKSLSN